MSNNPTTTWHTTIERDPLSDDLVVIFPGSLLEQLGWDENTELNFECEEDGRVIIIAK